MRLNIASVWCGRPRREGGGSGTKIQAITGRLGNLIESRRANPAMLEVVAHIGMGL